MKRDSFVRGALILAAAGLTSRVLGSVYRIILPLLMGGAEKGGEGIGLFQMAYPIYGVALGLSAVGIPVAISKLVAEKIATGDHGAARRVFRIALALLAMLGFILSALLLAGSRFLAVHVSRDPRAFYTIAAISPAIFLVSVTSAFRGYFQGLQRMSPSANSQILEQLVRVLTMFLLVYLLLPFGIEFAAAGATFGAVTGGAAAFLYLAWFYRHSRYILLPPRETGEGDRGSTGTGRVIWQIIYLAAPISLAGVILPVMSFVDMAVVPARLHAVGFSTPEATTLYGFFTGMAMPLVNMPTVFTSALAVSLVPAVSEASASGQPLLVRSRTSLALKLAIFLAVPAAAGLMLLAREIPALLWKAPRAGPPLAVLAPGLLFLALQQVTSGVLQGLGYTGLPVRHLLAGAAAKLFLTWWLTGVPALNINGAALGTVAGFLIASLLNLYSVTRLVGPVVDPRRVLIKPLAASALMGLAVRAVHNVVIAVRRSDSLATLAAIAVGMAVYGVLILAFGGFTAREVEHIPRYGPRLAMLLRRARILRGGEEV